MIKSYSSRAVSVPAGRLARASRLGGLTTGVLGSVAMGGASALLRGQKPVLRDLLLTPANALRLTEELSKMRGAAMKMGQLLSMEADDVLPPELAAILAHLRADAHFMPPKQLKQVLLAQYGPQALARFRRFDVQPVAAASIGQVHRAVAADGRVLALKIQYPGVRAAIDADIANLGSLLRLSGVLPRDIALAPFLDEARRQLHEEADYIREAQELERFHTLLQGDEGFALPKPQWEYCTTDILAMDFIESAPIEALEQADQSTRDAAATRLIGLFLQELFDWQRIQTDPNFANYRYQPDANRIVLLDFGASRGFPDAFVRQCDVLLKACLRGDAQAIGDGLIQLGALPIDAPAGQQALIAEMVQIGLDLLQSGVVDFSDTSIMERLRERGMRLGRDEGFRHIPPWDVLYMQRKIGGLVLLATRLGARVDIGALLQAKAARRNAA